MNKNDKKNYITVIILLTIISSVLIAVSIIQAINQEKYEWFFDTACSEAGVSRTMCNELKSMPLSEWKDFFYYNR